jgi:very-short-patch-repair endonuclease
VGDPKQLPPTDFFQRTALDDDQDDDDRAVAEEGESILDVAMSLYHPARRLRWHYRSRHHSLIAFSNKEFYGRDLIVFPTSHREKEDLGIRYHEVRAGLYEDRRNVPEAERIVEAILEQIKEHPDESLGIVTLNLQQRELIEELYQKALKKEVFAQAYVERFNEGLEPLFVKNLENVQGDERDVIFISCTYGPDRQGNQFQRFGPINSQKGHRRLNVLFTRAKKRVEVFSSLDPDKILVDARSAWGVRALKSYLAYSKTGRLEEGRSDEGEPTNDFELSVAELLREQGYKVAAQVGVAGFFIDLAVVHPYKPGAWLMGIECDGASYHSARSARDRDRLRQEILVNLGWTIYRVWSTDWFRSREREVKKLLSYIESVLAGDPEAQKVRSRENKILALRERLIEFREKTIRPAFPDAPRDRCLLRTSLLDALLRSRVSTRDGWFRKIPLDMRTATHPEQIGRFLDEVLQIIGQYL